MAGNVFGHLYRLTTFGESHGKAMGVVIDGCPPGVPLKLGHIREWTDRRKPGQSDLTTARNEDDEPKILSGVHLDMTLGTPIAVTINNKDHRPQDYEELRDKFRPSHADYTLFKKYQLVDWRGGGRASARETVGRVIGGAVAFQVLKKLCPAMRSSCYLRSVGNVSMDGEPRTYAHDKIYVAKKLPCPDRRVAKSMEQAILDAKERGDSLGAVVEFAFENVPVGLGTPVFDKLEAQLAQALMSLPASKAFEIGSGVQSGSMMGSEHNDPFEMRQGKIRTKTNHAGGVLGGVSSGELLYGRVTFKPASTIKLPQDTVDKFGNPVSISRVEGRHDPCVAVRAVPIVECMVACVLLDQVFLNYPVQSVLQDLSITNRDGSPLPA
ncbi:chorismate synthase [Verrucomicrobiota bacterium]